MMPLHKCNAENFIQTNSGRLSMVSVFSLPQLLSNTITHAKAAVAPFSPRLQLALGPEHLLASLLCPLSSSRLPKLPPPTSPISNYSSNAKAAPGLPTAASVSHLCFLIAAHSICWFSCHQSLQLVPVDPL